MRLVLQRPVWPEQGAPPAPAVARLLDEPSQGLGPRIVELIFEAIDRIRRQRRLTILLVEQRVVEALELCDRGYVLQTGRVVLRGRARRCWPTRGCNARTSARERAIESPSL
jgi:ABC-type branched-subunit amino acid transport system ATPase component